MTSSLRRLVATVAVVAMSVGGCGLDDGARVRNQDNVRPAESDMASK